jgi:hypothetical protein
MIHVAAVTDEALKRLVDGHRDRAGEAARTITPRKGQLPEEAVAHYRATQNTLANIYQELLDRRRADTERTNKELAFVLSVPR